MWITSGCGGERKDQTTTTTERSQRSRCRGTTLLRGEGRGRTIVPARVADRVRVELELAIAEVEVRGVREAAIGVRGELVTREVGVQLLPADVTSGMAQYHGTDSHAPQTELVDLEDLAGPADGTRNRVPMTLAELCGDDQNPALLCLGELVECVSGADMHPQVGRGDLVLAVAVEPPRA